MVESQDGAPDSSGRASNGHHSTEEVTDDTGNSSLGTDSVAKPGAADLHRQTNDDTRVEDSTISRDYTSSDIAGDTKTRQSQSTPPLDATTGRDEPQQLPQIAPVTDSPQLVEPVGGAPSNVPPEARKNAKVHFASATSRGDQTRLGKAQKVPKPMILEAIPIQIDPRPQGYLSPTGDDRTADQMLDPDLIKALERERHSGSSFQANRPMFSIGGDDPPELDDQRSYDSSFPTPSISRQNSPEDSPSRSVNYNERDLEKAVDGVQTGHESDIATPFDSRRSSIVSTGSESDYESIGFRRPEREAHKLVKAHYSRQSGNDGSDGRRAYGTGVLSNLLKMYGQPSAASSTSTLINPKERSTKIESDYSLPIVRPTYASDGSILPPIASSDPVQSNTFDPNPSRPSNFLGMFQGSSRETKVHSNVAALIGATGNIAGAASPIASSIRPDLRRPGYGLSRFSLETLENGNASNPNGPLKRSPNKVADAEKGGSRTGTERGGATTPPVAMPTIRRVWSSLGLAAMSVRDGAFDPRTYGAPRTSGRYTPSGEMDGSMSRRRRAKQDQAIYITAHISDILQRQDFILKLGRALLKFGAPSHRLEEQLTLTARVLEIDCQVIYFPGILIVNFGDVETHTSEAHFVKQAQGLDLHKLKDIHGIHRQVTHDQMSATEASQMLREAMKAPSPWRTWQMCFIAGMCSLIITPTAFNGSIVDGLAAFPLGAFLAFLQLYVSPKSSQYSNVFEISASIIASFAARGLDTTTYFCFSAIASGSVVLILPGYIVLCGALELSSRNLVSGSVRTWYSVVYSLFLGFGLSFGANIYDLVASQDAPTQTCTLRHDKWYLSPYLSRWWLFLLAPSYLLCLSLWLRAPWRDWKQFIVMEVIGCAGYAGNFYVLKYAPSRSDVSAAVGSFIVALLGNAYGKLGGSAFTSMVPGVMFLVPSGFAAQGGLALAATSLTENAGQLSSGILIGFQMVTVSVGIVVGLFGASLVLFPLGKKRGGLFSF